MRRHDDCSTSGMHFERRIDMKAVRTTFVLFVFVLFIHSQTAAQWTTLKMGLNNALTSFASVGNHVFGAYNQILCQSTDNGTTWNQDTLASTVKAVLPLVLAPGDTAVFVGTSGGLYRSNDFGASWLGTDTSLPSLSVSALVAMRDARDSLWIIAAVDSHGVFRSSDGGNHWTGSESGMANVRTQSLCVHDSILFLAVTGGGILRSVDIGATWSVTDSTLTGCLLEQDSVLVLGTSTGVYRSSDNGATWIPSSIGLSNTTIYCLAALRRADGTSTTFAGSEAGVWGSTDGGQSWSPANGDVTQSLGDKRILALGIHDTTLFAGTFLPGYYAGMSTYGTFRSTNNGATWNEPCTSTAGGTLTAVGRDLYCTEGERILQLNKDRDGWHSIWETSYPTVCSSLVFGPDSGAHGLHMAVLLGNAIVDTLNWMYRSVDGGATWSKINFPAVEGENPNSPDVVQFLGEKDSILFFHILPHNNFVGFSDSVGGLFQSSDGGKTWARSTSTALNQHLVDYGIADLVTLPDPSAAGGKSIFIGTWNGVFRSTDNGGTWSQDTVGITMRGLHRPVRCGGALYMMVGGTVLTSYDQYGNMIQTPTGTAIYRWDAASETWKQSGTNLPIDIGRTFAVSSGDTDPDVPLMVVYGVDTLNLGNVVCASVDAGFHWGYLPSVNRFDTQGAVLLGDTVYEAFSYLFLPGHVRKARLADIVVTGITEHQSEIAEGYALSQNYPNPFNPTTTITYTLPRSSRVKLTLFDVLGREVEVLENAYKTAGSYSVRFDAGGLASGVYFYRLQAGEFVGTRRLLFLK